MGKSATRGEDVAGNVNALLAAFSVEYVWQDDATLLQRLLQLLNQRVLQRQRLCAREKVTDAIPLMNAADIFRVTVGPIDVLVVAGNAVARKKVTFAVLFYLTNPLVNAAMICCVSISNARGECSDDDDCCSESCERRHEDGPKECREVIAREVIARNTCSNDAQKLGGCEIEFETAVLSQLN